MPSPRKASLTPVVGELAARPVGEARGVGAGSSDGLGAWIWSSRTISRRALAGPHGSSPETRRYCLQPRQFPAVSTSTDIWLRPRGKLLQTGLHRGFCGTTEASSSRRSRGHRSPDGTPARSFIEDWSTHPGQFAQHAQNISEPTSGIVAGVSDRVVVHGRAVELSRQAAGMTQAELANAAGLSQGFISKLERGGGEVADDMALHIADALHIPLTLLTVDETELVGAGSTSHHRRRSSRITALAARRVDALSHLTSLSVNRLMSLDGASRPPLPEVVDPVEAALYVRSVSRSGDDPIDSVVALVEKLGVVVVRRDLGSVAQDGVSLVRPGSAPALIVDRALPGDRQRFTVAHELGHVLLHHQRFDITDSEAEAEANRFAGSLLFPPEAALGQLKDLSPRRFSYLLKLKQEWGVSMASLIEQARVNDLLDATMYRRMRMTLSDRGWNRVEPGPLDAEVPGALPAVLDRQLDECGRSVPDLAEVALMNPAAFTKVYLAHRGGAATSTEQDVVAAGGLG